MDKDILISNLTNCISANYANAMKLRQKIINGEGPISVGDFDLNMIIDRSYYHLRLEANYEESNK